MRRLVFALVFFAPSLAAADIPPSEPESCTVAKQCKADEEGLMCHATQSEPDYCKKAYTGDGYVFRCKTRGSQYGEPSWNEAWCRPKAKPKPPPKK